MRLSTDLTLYQTGVVRLKASRGHSLPLTGGAGGGKGASRSKVTNSWRLLGLLSSCRTSAVVLTCGSKVLTISKKKMNKDETFHR